MRMDKLTTKFQMALADAQSLAVGRDHQFIESAHLMVALLDQDGGSVRSLLTRAGANANALRSRLGEILDGYSRVEGTGGDVQISADLGRALNLTDKLAQKRGDQFISSELFILAALEDRSQLANVMKGAGIVTGTVEKAIEEDVKRGQLEKGSSDWGFPAFPTKETLAYKAIHRCCENNPLK